MVRWSSRSAVVLSLLVPWASGCSPAGTARVPGGGTDATTLPTATTPGGTPTASTTPPGTTSTTQTTAEGLTLSLSCAPDLNPLRSDCTVHVDPPQPVQLAWWRDDGLGVTRTRTSDLSEADQAFTVIFLAPEQDYTVEASTVASPTFPLADVTVTTAAAPLKVSSGLDMTGTSTAGLLGTEDPCDGGALAVIYDTSTGDLVWFDDIDPDGKLGMLDMVRFTDDQTVIGETDGNIVEVDLVGNDIARFPVDYPGCCSLNHDIFKWNGNYYSQYQDIQGGLTLDAMVIIDGTGNEVTQWHIEDHIQIPPNASGDYNHQNSIYVDSNGDFLLSWLNQDSVGRFVGDLASPDFGEPEWIMAGDNPGPLGDDIAIDWSGIGGSNSFSGQHNFHVRNDGRYMLLDNDDGRGVVFTIDEINHTAHADAAYDTAENSCGAQGTAMDTQAGNAIIACNTDQVREYDEATGAKIWDATVKCENGGAGGGFGGGVVATRWYPLDSWQ